jgi:hypothetical protein
MEASGILEQEDTVRCKWSQLPILFFYLCLTSERNYVLMLG